VRLAGRQLAALFAIGAVGGLIGDAGHVQSGTTRYLGDFPEIWKSALWFPLLVGGATASLGELRARIASLRPAPGQPLVEALAAIAAVLAIYALTAIVHDRPEIPATVLIAALAVLVLDRFGGGRPAIVCGLVAAVLGPLAEIVLVAAGASEYAPDSDGLIGVATWLPALYFAFGVVVSRLTELLAGGAQPSRPSSSSESSPA
jgi:hypothetical protein